MSKAGSYGEDMAMKAQPWRRIWQGRMKAEAAQHAWVHAWVQGGEGSLMVKASGQEGVEGRRVQPPPESQGGKHQGSDVGERRSGRQGAA